MRVNHVPTFAIVHCCTLGRTIRLVADGYDFHVSYSVGCDSKHLFYKLRLLTFLPHMVETDLVPYAMKWTPSASFDSIE
jgi:hypothetical protein